MSRRQLERNLLSYPGGHHEAAWRHPDCSIERVLEIGDYQDLARRAEAAKLDAVLLAPDASINVVDIDVPPALSTPTLRRRTSAHA